jgi:hypothetical protein
MVKVLKVQCIYKKSKSRSKKSIKKSRSKKVDQKKSIQTSPNPFHPFTSLKITLTKSEPISPIYVTKSHFDQVTLAMSDRSQFGHFGTRWPKVTLAMSKPNSAISVTKSHIGQVRTQFDHFGDQKSHWPCPNPIRPFRWPKVTLAMSEPNSAISVTKSHISHVRTQIGHFGDQK